MTAIQELIAQRRAAGTPDTYKARAARLHGQLLRVRKAKKIAQSEMAERLGISRETFRSWENSVSEPSATNLFRWADMLGIRITSEARSGE